MALNIFLAVFSAALLASGAHAITDADVLQFALNLEYLEANYYSCAAFGTPIKEQLWGGGPKPTGCESALLSAEAKQYAASIAHDEVAHVLYLRAALTAAGAKPVPQPALNIGSAFSAAANAAFGTTLSPDFSPYGSDALFYLGAYIFEDVGATAYYGAIAVLDAKPFVVAAAGILGTEAYHAATVRTLLYQVANEALYPYGVTVGAAVLAISKLRDAAGGTHIDKGLYNGNKQLALVPGDHNALIYARTPAEVLSIVYLTGTSKGGFFPKGLNGVVSVAK